MTIHKFNCEMSDRTVAFDFRLSPTDRPLRVCVSKTVYFSVNEYRIREIARSLVECTDGFTTPTPITKHRVDYSMVSFNFDHLKRLKIGRTSAIDPNVTETIQLKAIPLEFLCFKSSSKALEFATRVLNLELLVTDQFCPGLSAELISELFALLVLTEIQFSFGRIVKKIERMSSNKIPSEESLNTK